EIVLEVIGPEIEARRVIVPAMLPVTVSEATPATALGEPRPVTVPVPEVWAKVTGPPNPVTALLWACWTVGLKGRVSPAVRSVVRPASSTRVAYTTLFRSEIVLEVIGPEIEARRVIVPAMLPVTVSEATPATALGEPRPLTVPVPEVWAKVTG